jgi:hypothetical protein
MAAVALMKMRERAAEEEEEEEEMPLSSRAED